MDSVVTGRRLGPEARREHLLAVARRQVAEHGLADFSLGDVARAAGVAPSLPRHYFGTRDGLLVAVTEDVLSEVLEVLLAPREPGSFTTRFAAYLDIISRDPWVHRVWMQAADLHPDLGRVIADARRQFAEFSFDRSWTDMSPEEQCVASGWIGYVEAVVSTWIEQGLRDRRTVVRAIVRAGASLGVSGA